MSKADLLIVPYWSGTHKGSLEIAHSIDSGYWLYDHMYMDGVYYALHDYLDKMGRMDRDSTWTIDTNSVYVSHLLDVYCTNGEERISLLIDIMNKRYTVLKYVNKEADIEKEKAVAENNLKVLNDLAENEAKQQEKIELVRSVYERNCDMVNEFLRDFSEKMKTIDVYSYDFTGDNQPEIILTKRYVDDHTDEVITYNYVYDQTGNELFYFMGYLEYTEVYAEEDSESFYIQTSMHWAIHSDSVFYYKITKQEQKWKTELLLVDWIFAKYWSGAEETHDFFYIPEDNELDVFEKGIEGIAEIKKSGKYEVDMEQVDQYLQLYKHLERINVEEENLGYI